MRPTKSGGMTNGANRLLCCNEAVGLEKTVNIQQKRGNMDKLIHGVGSYKKGKYSAYINGKMTPHYSAWRSMLSRCYCEKERLRRPTYRDCRVCEEWLVFQKFAYWYDKNVNKKTENPHLDKDLKVFGNKIYSPEMCLIVDRKVNLFITDSKALRGNMMIGASWHKSNNRIQSHCKNPVTGKKEHLGYFDKEIEAHMAWRKRKSELARQLASVQHDARVSDAIMRWSRKLDNNEIHTIPNLKVI